MPKGFVSNICLYCLNNANLKRRYVCHVCVSICMFVLLEFVSGSLINASDEC